MKRNKFLKFISIPIVCMLTMTTRVPFTTYPRTVKADSGIPGENELKSDKEIVNKLKALGLQLEQPLRRDSYNNIINKNINHPLGRNNLVINPVLQLAVSGMGNDYNNLYDIYDNPVSNLNKVNLSNPTLGTDKLKGSAIDPLSDWRKVQKAMVSADINGNGKECLVVVAIPKTSGENVRLDISVIDKSNSTEKTYTVVDEMPKPLSNREDGGKFEYAVHAAAGDFNHDNKDEIAITVGRTLYICTADIKEAKVISSIEYNEGCNVAKVANSQGNKPEQDDVPALGVEAEDIDGDGFKELLVTTGSTKGGSKYTPRLLIYNSTDVTNPCGNIELKIDNSKIFQSPSVTMGDMFGNGQKEIVVGGIIPGAKKDESKFYLAFIKYDATTKQYGTKFKSYYELLSNKESKKEGQLERIKSSLVGLKCVALDKQRFRNPQYLVLGDFIFKYNTITNKFDQIPITQATNDTGGKVKPNTYKVSGAITNTNLRGDKTYILNTIVGNFDGNNSGKEQIMMLHYNRWYDNDYVYVTNCYRGDDGNLYSNSTQIWKNEKNSVYNFPAISSSSNINKGIRLEYNQDKSKFTFSDPTVVAVLGASPYFKELNKGIYAQNLSKLKVQNKFKVDANLSLGYDSKSSILGSKINGLDFEACIKEKVTNLWNNSINVNKEYSIETNANEDMVVVSTIPYDVYNYNVYNLGKMEQLNVNIPYDPIIKVMSLKDYNEIIKANGISNSPNIGYEVLKHNVGDPRTYPDESTALSNTPKGAILKEQSFLKAGFGTGISTQIISSYNREVYLNIPLNVAFKESEQGINAISKSNVDVNFLNSKGFTGVVANVPENNKNYDFSWKTAAYNYDLPTKNSTQKCMVISYLVNKDEFLAPLVPENLRVTAIDSKSITLQWDKVNAISGYKVTRSLDKNGTYSEVGNLVGNDKTTFTDNSFKGNEVYYYKVSSYFSKKGNSVYSMESEPIKVETIGVKSVIIKNQPKCFYIKGNALDISGLVVTINKSDGTSQDVNYSDFKANNLTVNVENGMLLSTSDNGKQIVITHTPSKISVNADKLIVNLNNLNNFEVKVSFKVGTVDNANKLYPNALLTVNALVKNNLSYLQNVVVIIALYDPQGNIDNLLYFPESIDSEGVKKINGFIKLPSEVEKYKVKVFVLNKLDNILSTEGLQSNVVQMP